MVDWIIRQAERSGLDVITLVSMTTLTVLAAAEIVVQVFFR